MYSRVETCSIIQRHEWPGRVLKRTVFNNSTSCSRRLLDMWCCIWLITGTWLESPLLVLGGHKHSSLHVHMGQHLPCRGYTLQWHRTLDLCIPRPLRRYSQRCHPVGPAVLGVDCCESRGRRGTWEAHTPREPPSLSTVSESICFATLVSYMVGNSQLTCATLREEELSWPPYKIHKRVNVYK